jgi:hypothetical protein
MKKLLLASCAICIASAAHATDVNPDPGFANIGLHMPMGDTPQPAISAGKLHFSGNTSTVSMTMDMLSAPDVKLWHRYRVTWDQSAWSQGSSQIVLAKPMMGVANGTNIAAVDIHGLTAIPSTFDRNLGLVTVPPRSPTGTPDNESLSAFRIFWSAGPMNSNDPVVYNGQQGVSHPHQYFGNTWTPYHPEANYALARAHGGTTSGNLTDERYPQNRSSYWFPPLMDIVKGYTVKPHGNLYYKRYWLGSSHCHTPLGAGSCVEVPHGLRMVAGFNFSTHSFPAFDNYSWTGGGYVGPDMQSAINAAFTSSGLGAPILLSMSFPQCWNGTLVDTPNHRSHMDFPHYGDGNQCPEDHPYRIAEISVQIFYNINQDALNGEWRLTSDSMEHGSTPGSTAHWDYFEAWDPDTAHEFHTGCEDVWISCSDGDLGDGKAVPDGDKLLDSGGLSVPSLDTWRPKSNITPLGDAGYSQGCVGNKTCTAEIVANANGTIMVMSQDGLIADVDNVHVTEIQTAH